MQKPKISLVASGSKLRPLVVNPKVMSFGVFENRASVNAQAVLPIVACVMFTGGSKPGMVFSTATVCGCNGFTACELLVSPI